MEKALLLVLLGIPMLCLLSIPLFIVWVVANYSNPSYTIFFIIPLIGIVSGISLFLAGIVLEPRIIG